MSFSVRASVYEPLQQAYVRGVAKATPYIRNVKAAARNLVTKVKAYVRAIFERLLNLVHRRSPAQRATPPAAAAERVPRTDVDILPKDPVPTTAAPVATDATPATPAPLVAINETFLDFTTAVKDTDPTLYVILRDGHAYHLDPKEGAGELQNMRELFAKPKSQWLSPYNRYLFTADDKADFERKAPKDISDKPSVTKVVEVESSDAAIEDVVANDFIFLATDLCRVRRGDYPPRLLDIQAYAGNPIFQRPLAQDDVKRFGFKTIGELLSGHLVQRQALSDGRIAMAGVVLWKALAEHFPHKIPNVPQFYRQAVINKAAHYKIALDEMGV